MSPFLYSPQDVMGNWLFIDENGKSRMVFLTDEVNGEDIDMPTFEVRDSNTDDLRILSWRTGTGSIVFLRDNKKPKVVIRESHSGRFQSIDGKVYMERINP